MKAIVPSSLLLLAALLSIATLQVDPASAVAAPASSSKAKGAKKLRNKKNTNQNKNQQKKTNKNKKKTKNKNKKKTKNKKKNAKKTRSIVITTKDCTAVSNVATDDWCNTNCNHNPSFCPADLCTCDADGGDGDSTPSSSTTTTAPGSVPGPAPSPSTTTAAPVTKPPSDGADCVNIWTDKKCANRMQNAEGNGKLENMCTKWNAGLNCEKSCRARGFVHRDSTCDNPSATTTNAPSTSTAPAPSTTTTTRSTTTPSTTTPTPTPTPTPGGEEECQGGGAWANDVGMADWCKVNCPGPQCVTSGPGATCTEACNDNAEPSPAPPPSTPSTSTPAPVTPAPSPSTPAPGTPAPVPVTPAPAPSPLPPSSDDLIRSVVQVLESAPYEFQSLDPSGNGKRPSQLYKWQDMIKAVQSMAEQGVGDWKLFLGDAAAEGMDVAKKMGLANIAAFLAQSMKETIQYDACDENNWSDAASTGPGAAVYSAASACGQLGQSYQDYQCSAEDNNIAIAADGNPMACEVDPNMELRANTHAEWYGAPAAMFCAPKSKVPNAPRWDYASPWCPQEGGYGYERPRFDPSETWENWGSSDITDEFYKHVNSGGGCSDYLGQKAGGWSFTGSGCVGGKCANSAAPNFNRSARTDVEGCCWWGRGVIQTTGVCNFGKLNFYLGKRAKDLGKAALYPNIDFCRNPESICEPNSPPELKWTAGLFYWLASVQTYESDRYDFDLPALLRNVATNCPDGGASCTNAVTALNDATSGLVNRGCPSGTACSSGAVDGLADRLKNLQEILRAVGIIN